MKISATGFVDASGDAALTWLAGLPCREAEEGAIYGTQMVVLENIDEANIPSREELAEHQKKVIGKYGLVRQDGFAFAFPGRGTALVNMTHVETPLEPVGATLKSIEGKAQADKVVHMLKSEYPKAFGNVRVRAYGALGIRQTRWIVGRHQLVVDEVRNGTRFPDTIARTAWPIELHEREGYVWEPFGTDHMHYVPLGSLTPPDADNLVAAGRCIDGDAAALSSVRVMGPCIAMGAAAAHALDLAGSGSVHQIDKAVLEKRLYDNITRVDQPRPAHDTHPLRPLCRTCLRLGALEPVLSRRARRGAGEDQPRLGLSLRRAAAQPAWARRHRKSGGETTRDARQQRYLL